MIARRPRGLLPSSESAIAPVVRVVLLSVLVTALFAFGLAVAVLISTD